jgi:ribosomal protein S18 acetylase RimI-like enzyme
MLVRRAHPADASGIAKVHVDSWRTTYRGIVPDGYLDSLSYEECETQWSRALQEGRNRIHVAENDTGTIVAFACGGPERTKQYDYDGELYAIYILREYQRKGIGRRLFQAVARDLAADGFRSLLVWVLADNPSRRFYEALGGEKVAAKPITIGGVTLEEVAYGWKDLRLLTAVE